MHNFTRFGVNYTPNSPLGIALDRKSAEYTNGEVIRGSIKYRAETGPGICQVRIVFDGTIKVRWQNGRYAERRQRNIFRRRFDKYEGPIQAPADHEWPFALAMPETVEAQLGYNGKIKPNDLGEHAMPPTLHKEGSSSVTIGGSVYAGTAERVTYTITAVIYDISSKKDLFRQSTCIRYVPTLPVPPALRAWKMPQTHSIPLTRKSALLSSSHDADEKLGFREKMASGFSSHTPQWDFRIETDSPQHLVPGGFFTLPISLRHMSTPTAQVPAPQVTLDRINFKLVSRTRLGSKGNDLTDDPEFRFERSDLGPFLEVEGWIHEFRVTLPKSIVPDFETTYIRRWHFLDIEVLVSCRGATFKRKWRHSVAMEQAYTQDVFPDNLPQTTEPPPPQPPASTTIIYRDLRAPPASGPGGGVGAAPNYLLADPWEQLSTQVSNTSLADEQAPPPSYEESTKSKRVA